VTWRVRDWWIAGLLLAGLLIVYYPALHGTPVWDDDAHLTRPELRPWSGLWRIWFDLKATEQYYPVTHSAFWLMHRIWGEWYAGYHLVNVLLHGLSAILLVRILRALEIPGAWFAAALWAFHPVQVESVAWMSELKNTLSGAFYFAAALAYLRFDRERSRGAWLAALSLFVVGLLSKSVIDTLPAALLLVCYWRRGTLSWGGDVRPLAPFLVIAVGSGLLTSWVERTYIGATGDDFQISLIGRCLIAGRAFWFYLGKIIWPAALTFVYPRWEIDLSTWWQYLFPAGALALAGVVVWGRRRWGAGPLVANLFFAGTLFPALGFVNVYPFRFSFVADHFQYLACAGPMVLAAAVGARLAEGRGAQVRALVQVVCAALLAQLMILSWEQCRMYADAQRLWRATLAGNPECWMAHNNLGMLLFRQGRVSEAIAQYQEALRLKPDYDGARTNLGEALASSGQVNQAMAQYREALRIDPAFAPAAYDVGNLLLGQGRIADAIAQYRDALRLDPGYGQAHNNLGFALLQAGRTAEAVAELRESLKIDPADEQTHYNLGNALLAEGEVGGAIAEMQTALDLQPANPGFQNALAWLLATAPQPALRDGPRAVQLATEASRAGIGPAGLRTLAAAYAQAGRYLDAVQTARQALDIARVRTDASLTGALPREIALYEAGRPYEEAR
jgi:tetratricopeptide (TPR) repeat protein